MKKLLSITEQRKAEHLDICANEEVSSLKSVGWDSFNLPHCALPEIDLQDVDSSTRFLGRDYCAPLLISSMTGGSHEGERINLLLAELSANRQIPMGVGSQRVALENKKDPPFAQLKKKHPRSRLWANIGAIQLNYGVTADDCKFLVDLLEAELLILHINPLQEAIQKEGDTNFKDLLPKIENLRANLDVPIVAKEVGCGLDIKSAKRLLSAGVDAIDLAGMGGTHWGYVEGLRNSDRLAIGQAFRSWGKSTLDLLLEYTDDPMCRETPLIASGGLRDGVHLAKAIYLGAHMGGMALPFLKKAKEGQEDLQQFCDQVLETLRIAMFSMGTLTVEDLRSL